MIGSVVLSLVQSTVRLAARGYADMRRSPERREHRLQRPIGGHAVDMWTPLPGQLSNMYYQQVASTVQLTLRKPAQMCAAICHAGGECPPCQLPCRRSCGHGSCSQRVVENRSPILDYVSQRGQGVEYEVSPSGSKAKGRAPVSTTVKSASKGPQIRGHPGQAPGFGSAPDVFCQGRDILSRTLRILLPAHHPRSNPSHP